jgi:two-component system, sensor histidine kinase
VSSLRARLWSLVFLALLPGLGAQIHLLAELKAEREHGAIEEAERFARQVTSETDRIVEGARGILIALSELPFVRALDRERCNAYLASLLARYEQFNSISIVALDGTPACAAPNVSRTANLADRFYFRDALERGFSIGEYVVGRLVRQPALPFAQMVAGEDGKPVAVAVIHLDLLWLGEYFKRKPLPSGGTLTLTDRNGVVINSTDAGRNIGTTLPPEFLTLLRSERDGTIEQEAADGTVRVLAYTPINAPPQGIWVTTTLPKQTALGEAQKETTRETSLIGVVLGLTLLGAAVFAELLIRRPVSDAVARSRAGQVAAE